MFFFGKKILIIWIRIRSAAHQCDFTCSCLGKQFPMTAIKYSLLPRTAMAMTMTMVSGWTTVCCIAGRLHRYINTKPQANLAARVAMVSMMKETMSGGRGVIRQRTVYRKMRTFVACILLKTKKILCSQIYLILALSRDGQIIAYCGFLPMTCFLNITCFFQSLYVLFLLTDNIWQEIWIWPLCNLIIRYLVSCQKLKALTINQISNIPCTVQPTY